MAGLGKGSPRVGCIIQCAFKPSFSLLEPLAYQFWRNQSGAWFEDQGELGVEQLGEGACEGCVAPERPANLSGQAWLAAQVCRQSEVILKHPVGRGGKMLLFA